MWDVVGVVGVVGVVCAVGAGGVVCNLSAALQIV